MNSVDLGTETTIAFATSSFTAEISSIALDGATRAMVDTTHLTTTQAGAGEVGSRTFLAGKLTDAGSFTIEGHFDADTVPPIEGPFEVVTITFPLGTSESTSTIYTFDGAISDFSASVPLEDKITFSATIKVSGAIAITAAT